MGKDEVDVPVATAVLTDEATPLVSSSPAAPYGSGDNRSSSSWKDGLCSCCKFGLCHPSLWNAWCCPQILMSQVLTRLHYDMFGNPSNGDENIWKNTFKRVVVLVIIYYMIMSLFGCGKYSEMDLVADDDDDLTDDYDRNRRSDCPTWRRITQNVVYWCMFLYTLIVMIKTRAAVRAKYNIDTNKSCCGSCEDCCCVFWCGCCTVAQLARQTADYDTYVSVCCSPTGLTENAPPLVQEEEEETLTPAVLV